MTTFGPAGVHAAMQLAVGDFTVSLDLEVPAGQVVALLGPNGAGKTTVLRALAGLERAETGRITISDRVVDEPASGTFVPAEERGIGYMFQDYLLFPHLDALDNVAFGLRSRGLRRRAARDQAMTWLELVGLGDHHEQRPDELSGGQAQRVALARALAGEPAVLLLDEPLAALDATTRTSTRRELRRQLDAFAGPAVIVSHDPLDALALADTVIVMEHGEVTQMGPMHEVSSHPRTPYVAELLGVNLLHGHAADSTVRVGETANVRIADASARGAVFVVIRPQAISLHPNEPDTSARNVWQLSATGFELLGDRVRVHLAGVIDLVAEITPGAMADLGLRDGSAVWATVKATDVVVFAD